jgi:hypothetical protein
MRGGIGDHRRPALGTPDEIKRFESKMVDHGFQVATIGVNAKVRAFAVGKARALLVVDDDRPTIGEPTKEWALVGVPAELQVTVTADAAHERGARA